MGVKVREKVKDSGEWWVFINHQGKRRSKKVGDKRAANAVARKARERLAAGDMGLVRISVQLSRNTANNGLILHSESK
jgi:integrase